MPWNKVGAAVVVVAQQFNPSIITQPWLTRIAGMQDEDFLPGCVFTDMIVQVRSRQFHMLIVAEQLQFVPVDPAEQQIIYEKLGAVIRALPHTPYRAVGLNFNWHLITEGRTMADASREMFFRADRPLFQNFASPEAHFGAYLSKDSNGFRLKLDVKPVLVQLEGRTEDRLQFAFNFHRDFAENPVAQLDQCLLLWDAANREADVIIDSVGRREQA